MWRVFGEVFFPGISQYKRQYSLRAQSLVSTFQGDLIAHPTDRNPPNKSAALEDWTVIRWI